MREIFCLLGRTASHPTFVWAQRRITLRVSVSGVTVLLRGYFAGTTNCFLFGAQRSSYTVLAWMLDPCAPYSRESSAQVPHATAENETPEEVHIRFPIFLAASPLPESHGDPGPPLGPGTRTLSAGLITKSKSGDVLECDAGCAATRIKSVRRGPRTSLQLA